VGDASAEPPGRARTKRRRVGGATEAKATVLRTNLIEERLVHLFALDLGLRTEVLTADQWRHLDVSPRFRFGYGPPSQRAPDEPCTVSISPGLLDEITTALSDDHLDTYLTAIEAFVLGHLMWPGVSSDQVMTGLENTMAAELAPALRLVSDVEMRAIDNDLVTR
jgi:hypothetical protein